MALTDNMNPKHNPVTTAVGGLFLITSLVMFIVKYIIPAFVVLKQEIPFDWWVPCVPLAIGILLVFMNDDYFAKIFNRADKVAAKKTDTQ